MTATPTWNPINTILQPGCRYLPVPYIIPGPGFDKSTVFNIELIACIQSTAYDATFISAAQKWMSVIIGDIPDYSGGNLDCGMLFNGTNVAICSNVDDVLISFVVEPIDGAYGTLGSAGPFYTHNDGNLPITGRMRFDSADWDLMVGRGTLEAVVMHEMGHVLGIGSLWGAFGFLNPANCTSYATPPSPKFLGTQAQSSMSLIDPSNYLNLGYVPVEDIGGLGTRCAHWKEAYLKQELMTGTVSYNGNPLSYLTAMSLQDMGYTVNLSSPIIARTFDVKTALQDPMPGKGDLEIGDCLHGFDINDIIKV